MKPATKKKLKGIIKLISEGATKEEVIKLKFSRSPKKFSEFLERIEGDISPEEKEILSFNKVKIRFVGKYSYDIICIIVRLRHVCLTADL